MAQKYNVYAVAYGVDPVTHSPVTDMKFKTWDECRLYINGVNGANYKGFLSDTEADLWLKRQQGMPRAATPKKPPSNPDPVYKTPVPSKRFKKSTMASANKQQETKEKFATNCVNLGLDPNSVIYYLMAQWNDMIDCFNIIQSKPPEEEDGEPPWFE